MKKFSVRTAALRRAEFRYLSEMLPQLQKMAVHLEEPLLSRLLEMAALEASLKLSLEEEIVEEIEASDTVIEYDKRLASSS